MENIIGFYETELGKEYKGKLNEINKELKLVREKYNELATDEFAKANEGKHLILRYSNWSNYGVTMTGEQAHCKIVKKDGVWYVRGVRFSLVNNIVKYEGLYSKPLTYDICLRFSKRDDEYESMDDLLSNLVECAARLMLQYTDEVLRDFMKMISPVQYRSDAHTSAKDGEDLEKQLADECKWASDKLIDSVRRAAAKYGLFNEEIEFSNKYDELKCELDELRNEYETKITDVIMTKYGEDIHCYVEGYNVHTIKFKRTGNKLFVTKLCFLENSDNKLVFPMSYSFSEYVDCVGAVEISKKMSSQNFLYANSESGRHANQAQASEHAKDAAKAVTSVLLKFDIGELNGMLPFYSDSDYRSKITIPLYEADEPKPSRNIAMDFADTINSLLNLYRAGRIKITNH